MPARFCRVTAARRLSNTLKGSTGQSVRLFTSDAAWASRDEAVRGTLELGKQADLVVLDRDLFKISHQDFNRVKVLETVLNGVTVYRAETL